MPLQNVDLYTVCSNLLGSYSVVKEEVLSPPKNVEKIRRYIISFSYPRKSIYVFLDHILQKHEAPSQAVSGPKHNCPSCGDGICVLLKQVSQNYNWLVL